MAILEALVCRLPVLITTACHFSELADFEGGIVVDPVVDEVTSRLRDLLERSPDQRAALGRPVAHSSSKSTPGSSKGNAWRKSTAG